MPYLSVNHPLLEAIQAHQSAINLLLDQAESPVQWHALNVAYEALKLAWYAVQSGYAAPEALRGALADYLAVLEGQRP